MPDPDAPVARVLQQRLREQVEALQAADAAVGSADPDSVHDVRVASRRLRACLGSFSTAFDTDLSEPLREELRWLARSLAATRDGHMVRERLLILSGADVGDVALVLEALGPADQDAVAGLARSPRYRRLLDDLDAFAAEPPWTAAAEQDSRPFLRRRIRKEWDRVAERMAAVSDAGHDDPDEDRRHEARKAAKRLRCALEVAELEWPKKPKRLRKSVHRLTDVLGELQDSAVTRAALRELAGRPEVSQEVAAASGRLERVDAVNGSGLESEVHDAWAAAEYDRRTWP